MTIKTLYTTIRNEVNNDPLVLGYSGNTDLWITQKINEVGASGETVPEEDNLDIRTIMDNLVKTEIDSLDARQTNLLAGILSNSKLNPVSCMPILESIFIAGTTTIANIQALTTKLASRAKVLGIPDVELYQVENALHTTWWDI